MNNAILVGREIDSHTYYGEHDKSRFAKAGSAEDCGHTPSGSFSHGNTCAGERGGDLSNFDWHQNEPSHMKQGHTDYFHLAKKRARDINHLHEHLGKVHNSEVFVQQLNRLEPGEKRALKRYTQKKHAAKMNGALRHKKPLSRNSAIMDNYLENALAKSSLPESIVVFRGLRNISNIPFSKKFDISNPESAIGSKIIDHGYMSTSINKLSSEPFVDPSNGVLLEIKMAEGTQAVTTNKLGTEHHEHEFLVQKGHGLEITGWRREKNASGHDITVFECKAFDARRKNG